MTIVYRQAPHDVAAVLRRTGWPRYGFDGILANEGFRAYARMVDALRHNRVLFAMMDQGVKEAETGVPLRFLGKDMPMPGGVVQLARQSRAPIVPVTSLAADPVWHFAHRAAAVLAARRHHRGGRGAVLKHVEGQILAHPELWSWQHRRWRKFPVAQARA